MFTDKLNAYRIILASASPRRQQLLQDVGIRFEVLKGGDVDECFPASMAKTDIPVYLAQKKAHQVVNLLNNKTIIIAADTIVWLNGKVINKPVDEYDAFIILSSLSNNMHEVITGVCILTPDTELLFYEQSKVYFNPLTEQQIWYYIRTFKPFDKAGAYGIQEWIGYIGINRIEGSFYNVMGLPIDRVYRELQSLVSGC